MGLIPKQTKAENKGMFGLGMYKMLGLMSVIVFSSNAGQILVNRYLTIPFTIGCVVIFWQLYKPLPTNPKKTTFYGLSRWMADRSCPRYYASIVGYAYQQSWMETEPGQDSTSDTKESSHEQNC